MNKIELSNITKLYGKVKAVDRLSLEIKEGEFLTLLGPSGCGKSTLLYAIAGLETNIDGDIHFNDKNISDLDARQLEIFHQKNVGMIFQAYYLIPSLNVFQNIILPRFFVNEKITERNLRAEMLLKKLSIANQRKKLPSILSGGEQQRVAIARALINNSQILFFTRNISN